MKTKRIITVTVSIVEHESDNTVSYKVWNQDEGELSSREHVSIALAAQDIGASIYEAQGTEVQ